MGFWFGNWLIFFAVSIDGLKINSSTVVIKIVQIKLKTNLLVILSTYATNKIQLYELQLLLHKNSKLDCRGIKVNFFHAGQIFISKEWEDNSIINVWWIMTRIIWQYKKYLKYVDSITHISLYN